MKKLKNYIQNSLFKRFLKSGHKNLPIRPTPYTLYVLKNQELKNEVFAFVLEKVYQPCDKNYRPDRPGYEQYSDDEIFGLKYEVQTYLDMGCVSSRHHMDDAIIYESTIGHYEILGEFETLEDFVQTVESRFPEYLI